MTDIEKETVAELRASGLGYGSIAERMSLSINTVKSYCIRNKLVVRKSQIVCLECGKPIVQSYGRKVKKFCSDACRIKWWNHHTGLMKANAVCAHCGKSFHGRGSQKYCSHDCYIAERFGKANVS
ncbi:hypothetical protein [Selenomonas sp. AB3002]|uniref:hypothetical protein n=1 Tax=Selenomonas sp. AB3002 TaxID=1392502 RepID=UPI000561B1A1